MKPRGVDLLEVWYAPHLHRRQRMGRLAARRGEVLFEYDADFLASGVAPSPFRLPLTPGVVVGDSTRLEGLPGVFDDSLPDGWGRLLVDRLARDAGLDPGALGPLDRLAMVGDGGLGALSYQPAVAQTRTPAVRLARLEADARALLADRPVEDLEGLVALGSSPQGARPKVLVWRTATGGLLPRAHPGASAWLVKFPGQGEDAQVGPLELAYLRMAGAAGIEVPPAELLGRTRTSPGYFAVQRFDRRGPRRIHLHTLGGLLELPRGYLAFDYRDLLATTRRLTRDDRAVSELFRRACFNVLARNRDDHVRNFAFLMDEEGVWRPSPAFDVTFSSGPRGEHSMLVMGEGLTPGVDHLRRLGQAGGVKKAEALLDEVRAALARFHAFADEAGVPAKLATRVGKALAVRRRRPSR